jgi:hypothetical protein
MARTYREIAVEEMLGTVEEAMSRVTDWWGDLPPPMKEAERDGAGRGEIVPARKRSSNFAFNLGVEFVKRAFDRQLHETDRGKGPF